MNSDIGFEPSQLQNLYVLDSNGEELTVARKFQLRAMEVAKQGVLGSLRTRKGSLQNSYALLVSLVDNMSVPFLIYGEKGSGKRRLVEEFLTVQNFYRRLAAKEMGHLKVLRGEFLNSGFSSQLMPPNSGSGDLIYIENIEALSLACQDELLIHLKLRKKLHGSGVALPRLIVGTEKALSIMVIRSEFSRELFQTLTSFAIFLPSLNERQEDMLHIVQVFSEEITGVLQTPPTWLIDLLARQLWSENMDDLKTLLKNGLARNAQLQSWTTQDLPQYLQPAQRDSKPFDPELPNDVTESNLERLQLKKALLSAGGNRDQAAHSLGLDRATFLKMLMTHSLR